MHDRHTLLLQVGDWGRRGQYNQSHVAAMMSLHASLVGPDFVVSVGDNFYPSKWQHGSSFCLAWTAYSHLSETQNWTSMHAADDVIQCMQRVFTPA